MRRYLGAIAVLVLAGCDGASGPASQLATLEQLSFEVPLDWRHRDSSNGAAAISVWSPEENLRRESVSVMRARRRSGGKPSMEAIEQELVTAQGSLRAARISNVSRVTTKEGLRGVQLDVIFKPGVLDRTYHRRHIVLVEDDATLVHVLYTAASADRDRVALELVLDTIRRGGAS